MNYRHIYHAGNRCDVFKHVVLLECVSRLMHKPTPLLLMDTHAGAGRYALTSDEAQKTGEARDGAAQIWFHSALSPSLHAYAAALHRHNEKDFQFYPGSPMLLADALRNHDRLILCEKHPETFQQLEHNLHRAKHTKNVQWHQRSGYEAALALLPPPEKRGFLLIDPPFEEANEWEQIIDTLSVLRVRWRHGTVAVWYPIKDRISATQRIEKISEQGWENILQAEFIYNDPTRTDRLNGCGILLLNAPWQLDKWIKNTIPELHAALVCPNFGSDVICLGVNPQI